MTVFHPATSCFFIVRSRLSEEKEWLVQDLKFLQECIEDENETTSTIEEELTEPSIGGESISIILYMQHPGGWGGE